MQIVLLRIGIDTGCGGTHGPLFEDGTFEYIPIPDRFRVDSRTYGTTTGRHGRKLIEYFPPRLCDRMKDQRIHFDPEFETFTYGDPTPLKARLRTLQEGDLLVFYAGLKGLNSRTTAGLYIVGFFSVLSAGLAMKFSESERKSHFARNFHVRHRIVFEDQKDRLVLVKGDERKSRLLKKAVRLSSVGEDRSGRPIHVLSQHMQQVFGHFGGRTAIQRCPPRWVEPQFVDRAARFVRSLR